MESVNVTQADDAVPRCQHYGVCGGCDLQHWSYARQLAFKEERVRKIFERFVGVIFHPIVPSPHEYAYRNRVTLHSDGSKFGFYQKKTHDLIAIQDCAIASATVNQKMTALPSLPPGDFEVREDDLATAFIQVNTAQNANLQNRVVAAARAQKSQRVLELYAGAGNLSFPLSAVCRELIAIEGNPVAVQAAQKRKSAQKCSKLKFLCSDVFTAVHKLVSDYEKFDTIVCDPPREGLRGVAGLLPKLGAEKIVMVSCEPHTLARDATVLQRKGFCMTEVTALDMFPQTHHVEVVALFVKTR